ncbi:diguanylate cyclase [Alteromonas sp. ALT199]|uniref:sensor domain-containing diguanylate cyclase n=1 Tax=unclassified Alteromonas TaxID=2614992 RepID=UPI00044F155B|nr:diguanylate cyclase [Alteromonas sp. ALT199]MBT3134882.1 diguanylate cyclase [Alteromonas sp. ALT199]
MKKNEALSIFRQIPSSILFKCTDSSEIYASQYFEKNFGIIDAKAFENSSITFFDQKSKREVSVGENPFFLVESGQQFADSFRLQTSSRTMNCFIEGEVVHTPTSDWIVLHVKTDITGLLDLSKKESQINKHITFNQLLTNFSSKLINADVNELDNIIDQALAAFGTFCDVDRCYLFEFLDGGELMSNTHEWAAAGVTPYIDELQNIPADSMPFFMSHIANGLFKVDNVATLPEYAASEKELLEEQRIYSLLCVRIMVDGTIYGFIGCDIIGAPYSWKAFDIEYLRRIGEMLGNTLQNLHNRKALQKMQIELLEANKQLERLANIDGLTGLANRRLFDATIKSDMKRSKENGIPIGLLLIDVDYFKQYNDYYGHVAGDNVLIKVAETLSKSCLGNDDLIARYGGEEFAIILPSTDSDALQCIAARILRNVSQLSIAHEKSKIKDVLTVSIGMACFNSRLSTKQNSVEKEYCNATSFIEDVDAALYRAKNSGRNCATF